MQLDKLVMAQLQQKRFGLPQESATIQNAFCNEYVYGKLNVLFVCGAIRLDADRAAVVGRALTDGDKDLDPSKDTFDAWPTAEAHLSCLEHGLLKRKALMKEHGYSDDESDS